MQALALASRARFAVLGNFVVDLIGRPLDRLPAPGRLQILETLETHPGGNGPNTAGALARLGAPVAALGAVGEDLYGRFLCERLEGWGTDTRLVTRNPGAATGVTLVAVDAAGERSFTHAFGANAAFGPGDIPWERLPAARHLHFGGFFVLPRMDAGGAVEVLAQARRRGWSTSLDVCWDREGRWLERVGPCLPHVDFAMPSEDEARALTGETEPAAMAAALRAGGCRAAVVKLGERGCAYSGPDGDLAVPAYRVPVRDTTGAGDCFIAGFLFGRDAGWDLGRCLRFANACGARAVGVVGAVTGMAPAAEIEAWAASLEIRP